MISKWLGKVHLHIDKINVKKSDATSLLWNVLMKKLSQAYSSSLLSFDFFHYGFRDIFECFCLHMYLNYRLILI